jgi:hypothetical protein
MITTSRNPLDLAIYGVPPQAFAKTPRSVDLRRLGLIQQITGGAYAAADILGQTADGRDLNEIWSDFQRSLEIQNEARQRLIELLIFPVQNIIEDVPQFGGGDFEEMSEYGVPKSIRPTGSLLQLGYTFKWYDLAARFTWRFLADANTAQVDAVHQAALDADNRLVFLEIMRTLFRSTNRVADINGQNYNVYTFWNGDGNAPPDYKTNTFPGSHTHFRNSGAATIDSGDLEEMIDDLKAHGYSAENGTTLFFLTNELQANVIRTFRQGVANNNGAVARWDFIPASNQPAFIVPTTQAVVGGQVASTYRGMNVTGSYGPAIIVEESYIPAGYVVLLGSGGDAALNNPIGLREHANAALRGLRLVQEKQSDYPLIDSYYVRGFGTGVRQRGAGMVMKIGAGGYTVPPQYA